MFDGSPKAPDGPVVRFIVGAEHTTARFLATQTRLRMTLGKSLIAAIGDDPHLRLQMRVLLLEQSKVMLGAVGVRGGKNLLTYDVDDDLAFEGVVLFLPTVVTPLFFLGRSIGVSVVSTKTTVHGVSLTSRRLGRLNAPDLLSTSSTCVTTRFALDSWMP